MHFWRMNKCVRIDSCAPTPTRISFSKFIIESIKNFIVVFPRPVPSLRSVPSCHFASAASMCLQQCARHTLAAVFSLLFLKFIENERQRKKDNAEKRTKRKWMKKEGNDRSRRWSILMRNKSYRQKRCVKNNAELCSNSERGREGTETEYLWPVLCTTLHRSRRSRMGPIEITVKSPMLLFVLEFRFVWCRILDAITLRLIYALSECVCQSAFGSAFGVSCVCAEAAKVLVKRVRMCLSRQTQSPIGLLSFFMMILLFTWHSVRRCRPSSKCVPVTNHRMSMNKITNANVIMKACTIALCCAATWRSSHVRRQ